LPCRCAEIADHDVGVRQLAGDLVAVVLFAACQVEQPRIGSRHLHADVAEAGGPLRHAFQAVERRFVASELREKMRTFMRDLERGSRYHATRGDSRAAPFAARSARDTAGITV
jgi:hypothetical protein